MAKTGKLIFDEDSVVGTLVALTQRKEFRSAWNYLRNNGDPEHVRFYDAGVVLQHLSDRYGDIGDLKDDCFLKKELEHQSTKIVELLL